jgi:transposase InsO family protein
MIQERSRRVKPEMIITDNRAEFTSKATLGARAEYRLAFRRAKHAPRCRAGSARASRINCATVVAHF